eukprot:gene6253-8612_t
MEENQVESITKLSSKPTLGVWYFDKKKRQRKYISLTGKSYTGGEAVRQARQDKSITQFPSLSARNELHRLVSQSLSEFNCQKMDLGIDLLSLSSLSFWGLPEVVVNKYKSSGVKELFQWQIDCLCTNENAALKGGNLIFSAPTSGGKTLVAEILMLRQIAIQNISTNYKRGTIFFVVPFVALAEEKTNRFQEIWKDLRIGVKSFHNSDDSGGNGNHLPDDVEVAVCTIERANILLTQLLDENREDQLKMIVVDEIHMLSDSHRGFQLEVMLSKAKYLLKDKVQIIGMSATLPNIADLAGWLEASLYTTQYRPVSLEIKVCQNLTLYRLQNKEGNLASFQMNYSIMPGFTYDRALRSMTGDVDGLNTLCLETIREGKSLLLFCNSKNRCENCSNNLTEVMKNTSTSQNSIVMNSFSSQSLHVRRSLIIEELSQCPVGLCPKLRASIPYGIAYHHAGLTIDERRIIENGFKDGLISILCTTSTLSAGVNLPAHRVIIRTPRMGDKFLTVASFRQMCGRAGRYGFDNTGEAILMITSSTTEKEIATHLCTANLDPLISSLNHANGGGIEKLFLEMISCRRLNKIEDVMKFALCTLLAIQHDVDKIRRYSEDAISFLVKEQFVTLLPGGEVLEPTPLGKSTTLSGISPRDAAQIIKPLQQARSRLILRGGLHPVFLVTPPFPQIEPNWANYEAILEELYKEHQDARMVAEYLGVDCSKLLQFKFNHPRPGDISEQVMLYKRFYSAIILFTIVQEWPTSRVSKLLSNESVTRGQLQQLQKDASTFCGMIVVFCRNLNWSSLASCFEDYISRLSFGAKPEIMQLVRIGAEVTPIRARCFLRDGISTAEELVQSGVRRIADLLMDTLPVNSMDTKTFHAPISVISAITVDNNSNISSSHMACERLARKIITRAKEYLKEEFIRINSSLINQSSENNENQLLFHNA